MTGRVEAHPSTLLKLGAFDPDFASYVIKGYIDRWM